MHAPEHRPALDITEARRDDGTVHLVLEGELDYDTCEDLDHALGRALTPGTHRLVVDLGGVTFMDSSGIVCLLRARRAAPAPGGLRVVNAARQPLERLSIAGVLDHLTRTAEDEDPASAAGSASLADSASSGTG
ncbi:STAS domain-containing protein [Streptomyces sp. NPDC001380]|uniref:STAS domain-containing protein n=1 Tax=Streptomyces sp. NPDC001380 TaxID=3364566 RepID=UPI003680061C